MACESDRYAIFLEKMVHYTFQKILSRFDFFDEIFDFGSIWRPHRTFNRYILLVFLSLPIDQQLCQRIWSLHYWFGCSDSPKLPISCKNSIFAICGHFWAWPLWATFWISIFKLSYDTFPMIEFMYPAP